MGRVIFTAVVEGVGVPPPAAGFTTAVLLFVAAGFTTAVLLLAAAGFTPLEPLPLLLALLLLLV